MPGHGQEVLKKATKELTLGEVIVATAEGFGETATAGKEGLGEIGTVGKEGLGETAPEAPPADEPDHGTTRDTTIDTSLPDFGQTTWTTIQTRDHHTRSHFRYSILMTRRTTAN